MKNRQFCKRYDSCYSTSIHYPFDGVLETGNEVPGNRLRVRIPCPPLVFQAKPTARFSPQSVLEPRYHQKCHQTVHPEPHIAVTVPRCLHVYVHVCTCSQRWIRWLSWIRWLTGSAHCDPCDQTCVRIYPGRWSGDTSCDHPEQRHGAQTARSVPACAGTGTG